MINNDQLEVFAFENLFETGLLLFGVYSSDKHIPTAHGKHGSRWYFMAHKCINNPQVSQPLQLQYTFTQKIHAYS